MGKRRVALQILVSFSGMCLLVAGIALLWGAFASLHNPDRFATVWFGDFRMTSQDTLGKVLCSIIGTLTTEAGLVLLYIRMRLGKSKQAAEADCGIPHGASK